MTARVGSALWPSSGGQQFKQQQQQQHRARLIRDETSGQLALSLGAFQLPAAKATGEPLRLACHMLLPDEDEPRLQLDQLELAWYLNNSFNERRLLAKQTGRSGDLKLIDAHQSDLLGLPWQHSQQQQQQQTAGFLRKLNLDSRPAAPTTANTRNEQRATKTAPGGRTARLAVAYLNLSWDQASSLEGQIGQLYCTARNSIGDQRRACLYSLEAPLQPGQQQQQQQQGSRFSAGEF